MDHQRITPRGSPNDYSTHSSYEKMTFMVKREVKQYLDDGRKSLDEGQIDKALQHYQKAVEIDPSCALCHFNLGYALHEGGHLEKARESYQKAIELEPTCSLFLEHLARLYFENTDYREAIRVFRRASLVGQIQPISIGLWGRALFEQGLYEQSIETFEHLLEKEKNPAIQNGANYWLAIANLKLHRIAAARRITEQLLKEKETDNKLLHELGENFIEAKCLSLAKRIFKRLSHGKEDALLVRLRLEDIFSIEKQIDEMLPRLFDGDEERLLHQIHSLKEFGNDRISKALLSFLDSPSAPVRESVIRYQTAFGYDVSEQILPYLEDPIGYVREAAFDYFEKMDDQEFLEFMAQGLNDPLQIIRTRAVKFIGRFGSIEKLPALEMAYTDPKNKDCREEIRKAITSIKRRYQKKHDSLSQMGFAEKIDGSDQNTRYDWKFWLLLTFHIAAIAYFIYFVLIRL